MNTQLGVHTIFPGMGYDSLPIPIDKGYREQFLI